ncbi:MAG: sulfite oxidase [Chloroflexota bacterium]|nr:sulfite oxidase [Chloroflexota bacterium]
MAQQDGDLLVVSADPFNAETRLERQLGVVTPVGRHYVRDHFPLPEPPDRLVVDGEVSEPLTFTLSEVRAMPARSLFVTLECAGNGRSYLEPRVPGEQWSTGAVGTAEWTGVPLVAAMERAGVRATATELLFTGADRGVVAGRHIAYERSLPIDYASRGVALLAYAMNGEDLTAQHGAPLRLVVPGWYGVASVKWLTRITAIPRPFRGFYQAERYVIDGAPLRQVEPRAVITWPADGAALERGRVHVRGYAWSGRSPLQGVEVSSDGGSRWALAALGPEISPYAWRTWEYEWSPVSPGDQVLAARALDADGAQPWAERWTALGYANNAVRPVRVRVL